MILVTGGAYQGKSGFIKSHWNIQDNEIADLSLYSDRYEENTVSEDGTEDSGAVILTAPPECFSGVYDAIPAGVRAAVNYQELIRFQLSRGKSPAEELDKLFHMNPGIILCSNEVGMGIVPLERTERDYREAVGRAMCHAAALADEVWRVICGIGERIK